MEKKYKKLDEYFKIAREEEQVVSKVEARQLIENAQFAPTSLFGKLIQGVKNMNMLTYAVAAIVAVAGITYSLIDYGSNDEPLNNNYVANTEKQVEMDAKQIITDFDLANNYKPEASSEDIATKQTNVEKKKTNVIQRKTVDVQGVKIVELNNDELELLGVTVSSNSVEFAKTFETENTVIQYNFSIDKKGEFKRKHSKEKTSTSKLSPQLVTDKEGNRIYMSFDVDSKVSGFATLEGADGRESTTTVVLPNTNKNIPVMITTEVISNNGSEDNLFNSNFMDSLLTNMPMLDFKIDEMINSARQLVLEKFDFDMLPSLVADSIRKSLQNLDCIRDNSNNSIINSSQSLDFVRGNAKMKMIIRDSSVFNDKLKLTDSLQNNPNIQLLFDNFINREDLENSLANDSGRISFKISMLGNLLKDLPDNSIIINPNILNATQIIQDKVRNIETQIDNYLQINKLIPFAIRLDSDEIDYIFWFEPTIELVEKLPAGIRHSLEPEIQALLNKTEICEIFPQAGETPYFDVWRACSGAIEGLTIFPNPVQNQLNLSYDLISERQVKIALHDLFGRELRVFEPMKPKTAGNHFHTFDVLGIMPGIYLLVVSTDNNEQAVQRVVIQD